MWMKISTLTLAFVLSAGALLLGGCNHKEFKPTLPSEGIAHKHIHTDQ
jgi:hypothetical protein